MAPIFFSVSRHFNSPVRINKPCNHYSLYQISQLFFFFIPSQQVSSKCVHLYSGMLLMHHLIQSCTKSASHDTAGVNDNILYPFVSISITQVKFHHFRIAWVNRSCHHHKALLVTTLILCCTFIIRSKQSPPSFAALLLYRSVNLSSLTI